jgi:homoserine dehydrogenase
MFQAPHGESDADIIFLSHEAREGAVDAAIERIQALPFVKSGVTRLRVEHLS